MTSITSNTARMPNAKKIQSGPVTELKTRHNGGRLQGPRLRNSVANATSVAKPESILIILPTALSIKNINLGTSGFAQIAIFATFAVVNLLLVAVALMRKTEVRFQTQFGPLILLTTSSTIVLTRPSGIHNVLLFLLVTTLAIQLARTVEAPRILTSLIDGIGLYALVSTFAYIIGLRSSTETEGLRIGLNSSGVNRIIFPLDHSLNLPPVLAAMYVAAFYFLIREQGWRRRFFRTICLLAAFAILVGSGTRVPALVALILPVAAVLFPKGSQRIAPVVAVFASFAALSLPTIISYLNSILNPLILLISDRPDQGGTLAALNGRDYVWERSLNFWREEVNSPLNVMLGYGMQGHYESGASLTYYKLLAHVFPRDAEKIVSVHNSYLQQLFDGGLLGWALLSVALFWTSVRLSRQINCWNSYGMAGIMAFSVVLLCSTTEILLHPSVITFWIIIVLVAVACQTGDATGKVERRRISTATAFNFYSPTRTLLPDSGEGDPARIRPTGRRENF